MTDLVAIIANGVVYGSIYGLVAIGMTLIYGTCGSSTCRRGRW